MELGLRGKVAFVSGSSKGMGKAAATIFAEEGARVVVTGRGQESVEATAKAIAQKTGAEVLGMAGDLTRKQDVTAAVQKVVDRWGPIDIAVSNVYGPQSREFLTITEEEWLGAYQQMVMHVVYLSAAVVPAMKERRWGRLINIGGMNAKEPHRELPLVTANVVRPAVVGLQKTLANELAPFGITVNNVLPGGFATERMVDYQRARALELGVPIEAVAATMGNNPMKRLGDPREIGGLIAFLASDYAGYITGTTIQVDGGRTHFIF